MAAKKETVNTDEVKQEVTETVVTEEQTNTEAPIVPTELNTAEDNGLTAEENELLEQLLQKTMFYAHPVMQASKGQMQEMFKEEHIITEKAGDKVQTEATKLKEDMLNLAASSNAKRVLTGTIVGLRSANPDSGIATNMAVVNYGHGTCKVYIPDYLLINYNIDKFRTPDGQKRVKDRIAAMIGTEIKFIVKQFDKRSKIAYADRLKAMEQDAYNNYIRPLNNTGKPRVQVGDIVRAQVTAVGRNVVTVYALGSEANIRQNAALGEVEVSYNYLANCKTVFKPNMIVNVRVLEIHEEEVQKYSEKYTLVSTKLSIKQTQEDPQAKYFDEFNEGELYSATVSSVTDNAVYVVINGKVDCMCAYPRYGVIPHIGEQRVVEITLKQTTDEKGNATDRNGKPIRRIFGIFRDV